MREILFKGKLKANGEWAQGYLFDNGFHDEKRMFIGGFVIVPYEGSACDKWDICGTNFAEVDPDTICQYTGLTDRNGNKIWENDIIQREDTAAPIRFGRYSSVFDYGRNNIGFYVDFPDDTFLREDLGYWNKKIIVIGNLFDNPELLQEVPK